MSMNIKEAMVKVAFRKEGEDHILISPFAKTYAGKAASMSLRKNFFFPLLGRFISPLAFMSWLATGDEEQRHALKPLRLPSMPKSEYLWFLKAGYLAKWSQLTSMHFELVKQLKPDEGIDPFQLPWVEYKTHTTGLKEFPKSQLNADVLKKLVRHNIEMGNVEGLKTLDHTIIPGFDLEEIQKWIEEMVGSKFLVLKEKQGEKPTEELTDSSD